MSLIPHIVEAVTTSIANVNSSMEESFDDSENVSTSTSNVTKQASSTAFAFSLFILVLLIGVILFLIVTSILGIVAAARCHDTLWIIMSTLGLFIGFPMGTIYYYFIQCVSAVGNATVAAAN